jgi:GT2 family glycosyltransferase
MKDVEVGVTRRTAGECERELAHFTAQRLSLQSALARARADTEIADAEREALARRLLELASVGVVAGAGVSGAGGASLQDELHATRRERDELARGLAQAQAWTPGLPAWQRELEYRARQIFLEAYLPLLEAAGPAHGELDPLAFASPSDRLGLLAGAAEEQQPGAPSVDVVVCVHDALDDLRLCLWSLMSATGRRFRLIVVNDGSTAPATSFLEQFAAEHPTVTLVHRAESPHGYTLAANTGLRACSSDYVVLLNSDTIVGQGWLQRLVAHGERNPEVGILGPLSNAASHQSVPESRDGGRWAVNRLPDWLTVDGMALILARAVAARAEARLPFINGFCYVVKREVIDAIGYLDEERFPGGYCEENDFSYRAFKHGFELAVVGDAYVYHAKSRSFGTDSRNELAKHNYQVFLDKHDREEIDELVRTMEADTTLEPVRRAVLEMSSSPAAIAPLLARGERGPLRVVFILPGLAAGGSGGSHSIYQEVQGMRSLGVPARIALPAAAWDQARATYEDADEIFQTFTDVDDLAAKTADADVISATHFKSVGILVELHAGREDFLPAYYVQDYEPFFTDADSHDLEEALASYTALPDMLLFAKTHWLCNVVGERHGTFVAKVEPSIDERLFAPAQESAADDAAGGDAAGEAPLRVIAMVRPRTPRRQPFSTVAVLERLQLELPDEVEVRTFGCRSIELARLTRSSTIMDGHLGLLSRRAVAGQLRHCDVFLDMSTYQAFGRTALEAMACGCTAIVPQTGGAQQFAEHGQNALAVDTMDLDSAFQAIAMLADDRERLRRLQANARATAARYSIVRAALSEYLLFEREHGRRFGAAAEPVGARPAYEPSTTPTIAV